MTSVFNNQSAFLDIDFGQLQFYLASDPRSSSLFIHTIIGLLFVYFLGLDTANDIGVDIEKNRECFSFHGEAEQTTSTAVEKIKE